MDTAHDMQNEASNGSKCSDRGPILVEICVEDVAGVKLARIGGADRVELCREVECGGLTPSAADVIAALPEAPAGGIQVLVRSRAGDFEFSNAEVSVMCEQIWEIEAALKTLPNRAELPPVGYVFGAITNGVVNEDACKLVKNLVPDAELTFHRAFDQVTDQFTGLKTLADIGFNRILTTGGDPTQAQPEQLTALCAAGNRLGIDILGSGGLRAHNVRQILDQIPGLKEIHMRAPNPVPTSAMEPITAQANLARTNAATPTSTTSLEMVQQIVRQVKK